jgi:hypothetical protein
VVAVEVQAAILLDQVLVAWVAEVTEIMLLLQTFLLVMVKQPQEEAEAVLEIMEIVLPYMVVMVVQV